jgi:hypothetical protein
MGAVFKTVSEVRAANIAAGGRFFSRQNMAHAGDTLRSFALWRDPEGVLFIYRKPTATVRSPGFRDGEPYSVLVGYSKGYGLLYEVKPDGRMSPTGALKIRQFYAMLKGATK